MENLEDFLVVLVNFVDILNFEVVVEELKGNVLLDFRVEDILI